MLFLSRSAFIVSIHLVVVLPTGRCEGVNASSSALLASVFSFSLIRCPNQLSLLLLIVFDHGSAFVT